MSRLALVGFLLAGALLFAQAPVRPNFAVATVKPSSPEEIQAGHSGGKSGHGRLTMTNVTLKRCIMGAYGLGPSQIVGGPSWIDNDRFDIEAKAEESTAGDAELDAMLQSLLAERFHLALRRDKRTITALVLEPGKQAPKLEKAEGGEMVTDAGHGRLTLRNSSMDSFADRLSRSTTLPVVNRTGLDGVYNLKLSWMPDGDRDDGKNVAPSLPTAIQEQLGLRLTSRKTEVEVLVVDRAERPAEN